MLCDSQQVKVHFRLRAVCEEDEEVRTVAWETSKAPGVKERLVRVKDGEQQGCQMRDMQGNGLSGKVTHNNTE